MSPILVAICLTAPREQRTKTSGLFSGSNESGGSDLESQDPNHSVDFSPPFEENIEEKLNEAETTGCSGKP